MSGGASHESTARKPGFIELVGGLEAFFVPAKSGLSSGSENTPVLAFLGFSYDGPRAWDILRDEER